MAVLLKKLLVTARLDEWAEIIGEGVPVAHSVIIALDRRCCNNGPRVKRISTELVCFIIIIQRNLYVTRSPTPSIIRRHSPKLFYSQKTTGKKRKLAMQTNTNTQLIELRIFLYPHYSHSYRRTLQTRIRS